MGETDFFNTSSTSLFKKIAGFLSLIKKKLYESVLNFYFWFNQTKYFKNDVGNIKGFLNQKN